jgi:hypothetical protein
MKARMPLRMILAAGLCLSAARAQDAIKHRFLAVDNGGNRLLLVDQTGGKGWSVAIPAGSRDLQWLPGGKILVSHGTGAAEYDLATGAKGWTVDGLSDITTAVRLADGNTLIGGNTSGITLYEYGPDKAQKSKLNLPGLADLRLARRLADGHTLLGLASSHRIVEVDAKGATVWTGALTDKGYVAYRLGNGHTLATSGEDCFVYDLAADGKATVLAGGLAAHPGQGLLWFSGFEVLANGHYFIANWNGHGKEGQGPHAVEFDGQNKLVWKWDDHAAASTVTNVMTVEGAGPTAIHDWPRRIGSPRAARAGKDALGRSGPARGPRLAF